MGWTKREDCGNGCPTLHPYMERKVRQQDGCIWDLAKPGVVSFRPFHLYLCKINIFIIVLTREIPNANP